MGILIHEPEVKWTAAEATARRLTERHYRKGQGRMGYCDPALAGRER